MAQPAEKNRHGILLESGTNEVEFIEFFIGGQSFGVNVAKVKQMVVFTEDALTRAPRAAANICGLFFYRDKTIPLLDLNGALGGIRKEEAKKPLVMVTEFNGLINGFLIDGVNRIYRVSWNDVQPLNPLLEKLSSCFTGSINIDKKEILIVDLEQLVAEINPDAAMKEEVESGAAEKIRSKFGSPKVLLAEDSTFIRKTLIKSLQNSGFEIIAAFDNGKSAYEKITEIKNEAVQAKKSIGDFVDIILTDIEMPRMDGLTLCRLIKEDAITKSLPLIVFSSLINNELAAKCRKVGVDGFLSKPDIENLRELMLKFISERKP